MSRATSSITRRLCVTVLVFELLAAIALISAITVHERNVQLKAFDATLLGTAQSLMGAVGDAEDTNDNVMLETRGLRLGRNAIYRVVDDRGRVLGSAGSIPDLKIPASSEPTFHNLDVAHRRYRFVTLHGVRVIDPGLASGGVQHEVDILYGAPVGHVWHEVLEAVRFFAIATLILFGMTAVVMAWMIRRGLSPIHELAREADRISSNDWHFNSPASAKDTAELAPLATALEAALARLERSFQQQRRFTSDAAHELKTDVAIVKSSLQLLSMRRRSVEEYNEGLSVSLEDFTRLETTVQKMLALARLEQPEEYDRTGSATSSCSLGDALEDVVDQSRSLAELKGIVIETRSSDERPSAHRWTRRATSLLEHSVERHSP